MNREEVVQRIQQAHIDGEPLDLSHAKLHSADLSNLDLSDAILTGASLTSANLTNARLLRASLVKADLTFATLHGTDFSGADLSLADLREADFEGAVFIGAKLDKVKGISRENAAALSASLSNERTRDSIRAYEAELRSSVNIHTSRPNPPNLPPHSLPYRWEGLKREAAKKGVPLKPLIKPIPEAIRRIEKELQRIEDTGMGRLCVVSGYTGAGKTTFLNSLDLFIEQDIRISNIKLRTINTTEDVENALRSVSIDHRIFSIIILEGRENPGKLKDEEIDILLGTLNSFFRSDEGAKTLFVIPTTSPTIADRIGERAATIGGMTSQSSYHYVFTGPSKNEYYSITDATFRALNESRTLNDYGVTDEVAQGVAQSSKSIGVFLEGCEDEIQNLKEELQKLSANIKRKRIHLWMVFCSYEDDPRINYNTIRSLTVGDLQQVQIKRLLIGDSKQVRFWEENQASFAQAGLYLDLRVLYLPLRTASSIITAYGYKELVEHLKRKDLVDREATRARAQESLNGTALGAFLRGKGFADPDLTRRRLTEQQQDVFREAAQFFSKDERLFNAMLADTIRDWYSEPDCQVVTELALNATGSLIADIGVVTQTEVYCLEVKWRSTVLHESEVARQTAGRVKEFVEELPELRRLIDKKLPLK